MKDDLTGLELKGGHPQDREAQIYFTDKWNAKGDRIDVSGGWYDAGDYGKYIATAGLSTAELMLVYEANPHHLIEGQRAFPKGVHGTKGIPDALNEVRYELDWMMKMQRADGSTFHKVSGMKWPGFDVSPDTDTQPRFVFSTATYSTGIYGRACPSVPECSVHTTRPIQSGFSRAQSVSMIICRRRWSLSIASMKDRRADRDRIIKARIRKNASGLRQNFLRPHGNRVMSKSFCGIKHVLPISRRSSRGTIRFPSGSMHISRAQQQIGISPRVISFERMRGGGDTFAFWKNFAVWWEDQGFHRRRHAAKNLYAYLLSFAKKAYALPQKARQQVDALLRFDALRKDFEARPGGLSWNGTEEQKRIAGFWRCGLPKKLLQEYSFPHWRDVRCQYHIEVFACDVVRLAQGEEHVEDGETAVLFRKTDCGIVYQLIRLSYE